VLSEPNAPFLAFLAAFQAAILKKGIADPTKEYIGTGPFKVESIDLTDRAVLVARDDYWKKDEPKVEKLELIFAQDITAHVQSLQGGQLDWVTRVPVSLFDQLKADAALTASVVATNQFPNIRIRADRGPGKDVKVRQALKYATDRAKLNEVIYKGLGTLGRDTPIGPLYGEFYSDAVPVTSYDPAKAKELLKEAGFADGLTLDFYGQKGEFSSDELVQVLAEQWKAVGITINIKLSDVYYNDGANNWLDADLAVTNWASRPDPQVYLELMYKSDGVWNEAHWKDEELDTLIAAARVSSDVTKRAEIFKAIQVIFAERGPSIIPFYQPSLALQAKNVSGIELAPDVGLTSFAKAEIK
jgi:peptide/nickel transport system substrate-binding protein